MKDDILDEELFPEKEDCNCECVKKSVWEKLKDMGIVLFFWWIMFYIFENYIMESSSMFRWVFYSGASLGMLITNLSTPMYKKKKKDD